MALQTMIDKLNAAKKTYDAQLKEIADQGVTEIGRHLAENIPPGWALWWTQYTPHFNDGEACHFSVRDVYLVPESKLEEVRRQSSAEEFGLGIYQAIERFGKPDEQKSYETDDYSRPKNDAARGVQRSYGAGYVRPEYEKKKVEYTEPGFPAPEGYTVDRLAKLRDAWNSLPEDLMERTFGDHAWCVVKSDGTASTNEYEHD